MKGTKSLSDHNDMIFHQPLANAKDHSFDNGKKPKKKSKNRKPIHGIVLFVLLNVCVRNKSNFACSKILVD